MTLACENANSVQLIEDSDSDVDSLLRVSKPSTAGKTVEAGKKKLSKLLTVMKFVKVVNI